MVLVDRPGLIQFPTNGPLQSVPGRRPQRLTELLCNLQTQLSTSFLHDYDHEAMVNIPSMLNSSKILGRACMSHFLHWQSTPTTGLHPGSGQWFLGSPLRSVTQRPELLASFSTISPHFLKMMSERFTPSFLLTPQSPSKSGFFRTLYRF